MEEPVAQEKQYESQEPSTNDQESSIAVPDSQTYIPEPNQNAIQQSWKPFACETCGKRFTLKGSLKTHEKLHGFRPTYNCDVCGKSFKVASGLKSHAALHSGQKPYRCEICGKTFTLKGSLKTHSALHSSIRDSFPCNICGKMYKGEASLKSHIALHSGKNPFTCENQTVHRETQTVHRETQTMPIPEEAGSAQIPKIDVPSQQQAVTFDFWHRFPQLFHGYEIPEGVTASQPVVARECSKKEICSLNSESPTLEEL